MAKKRTLGRGLEEIFGPNIDNLINDIENDIENNQLQNHKNDIVEIVIEDIQVNPYQPRHKFEDEKLQELALSIEKHGVFTPILVRKNLDKYQLIAGERRIRACKILNKKTIPAIIVDYNELEVMEVAILENIQRENLNAIEEAIAYNRLIKKHGFTQEELANRLGKSRPYISNSIRLLKLPTEVQQMVIDNKLSGGHIRCLITLSQDKIIHYANKAFENNLSVRELENLIKKEKFKKSDKKKENKYLDYSNYLSDKLQTKVKVKDHSLNIYFKDIEDFNRILEILNLLEE